MRKIYQIQIEVEIEESDEQTLVLVARHHFTERGGAEEPINDRSADCRPISAEESVPDTFGAIMQLILHNAVLEKAGIDVVEASCHEATGGRTDDSQRHA
jgi:hypothetical protein